MDHTTKNQQQDTPEETKSYAFSGQEFLQTLCKNREEELKLELARRERKRKNQIGKIRPMLWKHVTTPENWTCYDSPENGVYWESNISISLGEGVYPTSFLGPLSEILEEMTKDGSITITIKSCEPDYPFYDTEEVHSLRAKLWLRQNDKKKGSSVVKNDSSSL